MPNYFCKHCALKFSELRALSLGACVYSPTKRHVVYDGHESATFHCKHCGLAFNGFKHMVLGVCVHSPSKKHEPLNS